MGAQEVLMKVTKFTPKPPLEFKISLSREELQALHTLIQHSSMNTYENVQAKDMFLGMLKESLASKT